SIDSEIVDEDVAIRVLCGQSVAAARITEVRRETGHLSTKGSSTDGLDRPFDSFRGATVDDNLRARGRESLGRREANTGGRTSDNGRLSGKVDSHSNSVRSGLLTFTLARLVGLDQEVYAMTLSMSVCHCPAKCPMETPA